jgi:hypothetical protein
MLVVGERVQVRAAGADVAELGLRSSPVARQAAPSESS